MYSSGFDDWDWPDELNEVFEAAEASIAARKAHTPVEPLAELEALRTKLAAAEARVGELEVVMEHLRNYALIAAQVTVDREVLLYIHDTLAGKLS